MMKSEAAANTVNALFDTAKWKSPPRRWMVGLMVGVVVALMLATTARWRHPGPHELRFPIAPQPPPQLEYAKQVTLKDMKKPSNVTVVGLVFFGRRNRVEMLRCYLERNLVDNGGWLDEVHWVKNTDRKSDLEYLDELLKMSPRYKMIDVLKDGAAGLSGYGNAWGHLDRGKMYVKIDDDVVWFADDAIPRVVTTKLAHPEYMLVSANIINSPLLGWVHYHMDTMHPYLPEFHNAEFEAPNPEHHDPFDGPLHHHKSWRYTDYPLWAGPPDWYFDHTSDPPYVGHRWLRLPSANDIQRTPVVDIEYKTWGTGLKSWAIAAQEHYSFLENLQRDPSLSMYKFGRHWITDYKRLSINFMALLADDVLDNLPVKGIDEEWLTVDLPKSLGRHVVVESEALAVHFSFGNQAKGVESTDLLERYHGYAVENACARPR